MRKEWGKIIRETSTGDTTGRAESCKRQHGGRSLHMERSEERCGGPEAMAKHGPADQQTSNREGRRQEDRKE